ncbi:glycosyltransferase [Cutibacterium equinum]|uniref:Glycosyltransferase n=1 Tax=Cutibacterium equinum TaxID=3016342 RepID=A0ABY7QZL3_9ACTN|nr:glycosyltransferase [Cutibacterium equinum]WCC80120.1 glycosyltransferase [Cutibacterium equinum]
MTDVTVIIPVSQDWGCLPRQLQALANQNDAPKFEILVADAGCPRGVAELVERWRWRLDVRRVDATARPGDGYARNVAISHARSDLLMFTGTDVIVSSDWVRSGWEVGRDAPVFTGVHPGGDGLVSLDVDGCNFGVRRSTLIDARGFDASLSGTAADADLARRLTEAGQCVKLVADLRVNHDFRSQQGSTGLTPRIRATLFDRARRPAPDLGAGLDSATTDVPSVSVVIPHYGEVGPTMSVVRDLMAQEGATSFEIIVSDDCSPEPFPDGDGWTVVRSAVNGGYGAACNRGAKQATGEYVLFLNSDASLQPDFLRRFLDAARPWGRAVTAPAVRQQGEVRARLGRWGRPHHYIFNWATPGARFHGQEWFDWLQGQDVFAAHRLAEEGRGVVVDWVSGVAHMMPLQDFWAVGGFDEDFFMYCEEMDLHRRLREERGLNSVYLPQAEVGHVGGGSSSPDRVRSWNVDGEFRFFEKWGGAQCFMVGMIATSVLNFGWNCARKVRGIDVNSGRIFVNECRVIRHGWQHRKDSGPQRRPIRKVADVSVIIPAARPVLVVEPWAGRSRAGAQGLLDCTGSDVVTATADEGGRPSINDLISRVENWLDLHEDGIVAVPAGAGATSGRSAVMGGFRRSSSAARRTQSPVSVLVRDRVLEFLARRSLAHGGSDMVVLYEEKPELETGHPAWGSVVAAARCRDERLVVRYSIGDDGAGECGEREFYWVVMRGNDAVG